MSIFIAEPFGPVYPDLGVTVARSRNKARNGKISAREHGEAVLAAIRKLNANLHARRIADNPTPNCASGTAHNTGEAILRAVRQQNAARVSKDTNTRTPEQWRDAYNAAMKAKRDA